MACGGREGSWRNLISLESIIPIEVMITGVQKILWQVSGRKMSSYSEITQ